MRRSQDFASEVHAYPSLEPLQVSTMQGPTSEGNLNSASSLGLAMEKCFYHDFCGARSIHIFQCPQSNCLGRLGGRPTRIFLCRGRRCRERGCPHCPQRAAESDIFTSSDAVSETATTDSSLVSLMRPKSVAGEAAADGAKSVAADGRVRLDGQVDGPGASGVYLVPRSSRILPFPKTVYVMSRRGIVAARGRSSFSFS